MADSTGIPLADAAAYNGPATNIDLHITIPAERLEALGVRDAIVAGLRALGLEWLMTDDGTDVYLRWQGELCPLCGLALPVGHPVGSPGRQHTCPFD